MKDLFEDEADFYCFFEVSDNSEKLKNYYGITDQRKQRQMYRVRIQRVLVGNDILILTPGDFPGLDWITSKHKMETDNIHFYINVAGAGLPRTSVQIVEFDNDQVALSWFKLYLLI